MKAIILAGGQGSRLRPLTCSNPKPMVSLANSPVMAYGIQLLKKHGINEIGITVQYFASQIRDYFGDGSKYGVKLDYFFEDSPLGTAGSVKNAENFLDETFLVFSGDSLTDFDLTAAISFHQQKKSLATLILSSVDNPLDYGIVICKKTGEIVRFLEKPSWGEVFSDRINTGIYIFEPEILSYIPKQTCFDFSKNLFPLLMEKGHVLYGYTGKGYWCDIGNPQSYLEANTDLLNNKLAVEFSYKQYAPGIWVGENTRIHQLSRLEPPLMIGNNCVLEAGVYLGANTIIGDNCRISECASLKRSVLWNGVTLGQGVEIREAILCTNVQVKADTCVYEGAIVGNHSCIEGKCIIKQGARIWPHKTVNEGTVFKSNPVWENKADSKLFGFRGVKGKLNLDLSLELGLRLGAAFGALNSSVSGIAISSNEHPAAGAVKSVLTSGLQSVGQQVYQLGELNIPMTRYAIKANKLQGGVNVFFDEDEGSILISFFDKRGVNINKTQTKKIEAILALDDFQFVAGRKIKNILPLPAMYSAYFSYLYQKFKTNIAFKLVCSCPSLKLRSYLKDLLFKLGCEVKEVKRHRIKDEIQMFGADLGIYLDEQGEEIVVYDENGRRLSEDELKILLALLLLKENKNMTLVVPTDMPSVLEKLAQLYGGKIIRTKSALGTRMEELLMYGEDQFALEFDGVQMFLAILKILAREKVKLSELNASIPGFYLYKDALNCPWEMKGKILRFLVEEFGLDNYVYSAEGLKFEHLEGWALVVPDSEEPLVKIISEGSSYEFAEEIGNFYKNKILNILQL